ncbi:MAG: hypothetical protein A7315_04445 [Candidatus Altiarchaeales archaeon WOR_SM1_79]|nr:MAG: hypothetical protein A7315_04445 [Candidatus Altiarchaeales archaeon WOR_SM1_79]
MKNMFKVISLREKTINGLAQNMMNTPIIMTMEAHLQILTAIITAIINFNPEMINMDYKKKLIGLAVVFCLISLLMDTVSADDRIIIFSGLQWFVKSGDNKGPGNNNWSDSNESVWVDDNGWLHLRIRNVSGTWYCSEVYTVLPTRYGMHRFYFIGQLDSLDKNVVAAPFLYKDDSHEIDIEFSKWGWEGNPYNAQYVVQPWYNPGNTERFSMELSGTHTTHYIDWHSSRIQFKSIHGHHEEPPNDGYLIHNWTYTGNDIPLEEDDLRVHINLWLVNGSPPSDGNEVEIIVKYVYSVSFDEVILDDFEDTLSTNDFFGDSGVWHYPNQSVAKVNWSFYNGTYHGESGQSLKLEYNLTFSGSAGGYWWMFTYNIIDPDNPYDLSEFDYLKFWIKGDSSEGHTNKFYIELVDKDWNTDIVEITNVTTGWQQKEIDLTQLTNVNWTKMRHLAVKLESNHITNKTGVLYFDDVTFIDDDVNLTTDDQFLGLISRRAFNYFWENADPETGFVRDKASNREVTSVAAIGFELTAIGIGESRGWITREMASNRTLKILENLWNGSQGNNTNGCMGYKGFFYHLIDINTGEREGLSELSSVDTALLMAGVLFSGEYFNGTDNVEMEIRNLSDKIYRRVNWTWMLDPSSGQFYMAWKPENDPQHNIPAASGGYFSNSEWNYYTGEIILINLLAIGSPTNNVSSDTFYRWAREKGNYSNYTFYKSWWGSLFTYFFADCWFDLRNKIEKSTNIDWWENSRMAALSNREFCINESSNFETYGSNSWGLTASFGPGGYNGGKTQSYGAPPTGDPNGAWHDGTIAPYGVGSSIVFLSNDSTKNEAVIALRNYYHNFSHLWGIYGFRDAYNLGNSTNTSDSWFAHDYVGIGEGPMLLMIENYRSGMVWNTFMKNEYVQSAVDTVFVNESKDTAVNSRELIDLNGIWHYEPSNNENGIPLNWNHTLEVPGLVDLANPKVEWGDYNYHWYKGTFNLTSSQQHDRAFIKIDQSRYGTDVWLNEKYLGNYTGCYTSHKYDATDAINYGGENTLIVKVGSKYKYLFSWDDVPSNNTDLLKFLNDTLNIEWLENATINKNVDNTTINVTDGNNTLMFTLSEGKDKVILEINGEKSDEYISKKENSKLNIYLPPKSAVGHDYEKISFIPGIWGDVYLILTENPIIERVQIIPHIDTRIAEARITIKNLEDITHNITISSRVFEKSTGNSSSDEITMDHTISPLEETTITLNLSISNMRLWSPNNSNNSFLYQLVSKVKIAETEVDTLNTTFGMREFKIVGSDFYLNGHRVFLKGSNIAFHRFLSDQDRKSLPWNESWIKKVLIDIPKEHNFNFFRFHIGHAYNKWYDIADEHGMLLQDEWAFWVITGNETQIRQEFTQWLYDNCNHPSIIIWDAMNEPHDYGEVSRDIIRDEIIPDMKEIDPTRPWECGLNPDVDFNSLNPIDFSEDHPYIYSLGPVLNEDNFGYSRSIEAIKNSNEPTILNEFVWFWLDKNGTPTSLMHGVLPRWLGKDSTSQQRLEHQAQLASDLVELFRRIDVDGIAPFIYLSIEGESTSNWFTGDIANPGTKPIMSALKDAYAPFGLSIELWDRHFLINETRNIDVYVFNDYSVNKSGTLSCRIVDENNTEAVNIGDYSVSIPAGQTLIKNISWTMPSNVGTYYLKAQIIPEGEVSPAATSKKIIHVLKADIPSNPSGAKIMVYDPDNEILDYVTSVGLNASHYNSSQLYQQDILIIGEGALLDTDYDSRLEEITNFVKDGHTLIVIEPSYNITNYANREYSLLSDLSINMNKREDKYIGGYDSYCFMEDLNLFAREVAASSVEGNNSCLTPDNAMDNNPSTRWSSGFSDNQWIYLDLGKSVEFNRVVLRWEAAFGKSYKIQVSDDKQNWTTVYSTATGDGGVDEITFSPVTARYVRMYGTERGTGWGYSLWEFEVTSHSSSLWNNIDGDHLKMFNGGWGGEMISQCDVNLLTNRKQVLARSGLDLKYADVMETIWGQGVVIISRIQIRGRLTEDADPNAKLYWSKANIENAIASSVENQSLEYLPHNAIDGDTMTRWSSNFSDPQWIILNLSEEHEINKIILKWESAYGRSYNISVSNDGVTWQEVYSTTQGDGGVDEITFEPVTARYVRMYGTERGTGWGYSLWEFEVYYPDNLYSRRVDPVAQQYLLNLLSTYLDTASSWQRINDALPFIYVKEVAASSIQEDKEEFAPDKAIDNDPSTRWSSNFTDDEWIYVDLGEIKTFNSVELLWETAYGKEYEIQISNDSENWTKVYSTLCSDCSGGKTDTIYLGSHLARYVKMAGIKRGTDRGYSLWEFKVFFKKGKTRVTNVTIKDRQILVNGEPFVMKGVGYGVTPICENPKDWFTYEHRDIYTRDLPLLRDMNSNTIRLWALESDNHTDFLDEAYNNGVNPIYVIAGYWVDSWKNLSDPCVREEIKNGFRDMVEAHKDHNAILMWSVGNEINMFNVNLSDWYSLLDECAQIAHDIEGENYHPVTTANWDINHISEYYASTNNLDVWGANVYRGQSFGDLFTAYANISEKPFWISEYGIDALNNTSGEEYEETQAEWDVNMWKEIANSNITIGGTVMAYSDEWWKAGDPCTHDNGGYEIGTHPDGYSNEEWWGIMRTVDNGTGPDIMHPRKVYYALSCEFSNSIFCNSCSDCNDKLNNYDCTVVKLTTDMNHSGTCINNSENFTNKIFDCQGNTIDGNETGYGIYLNGKSNNTIQNCNINHFQYGIYLSSSSNNTLINNTADSNLGGIYLSNSSFNYLINNNITDNVNGVYFSSTANDNNLTGNTICGNALDVEDYDANSGDNNTCDTGNWNDDGTTNCTRTCPKTHTIQLLQGWNLISIPLQPANTSLWHVLAPIQGKFDKVFAYKGSWIYKALYDGVWYGDLDKIESGTGYWIYANDDVNRTIYGYPPDKNISLGKGWSLIGWPSNETRDIEEALASINDSYNKVFTYDQSTGWEYKALYDGIWHGDLSDMEPGRGYWIYMEEAGVLQVH